MSRIAYIVVQAPSADDLLLTHTDMENLFKSIPGHIQIGEIDLKKIANLNKILAQAKNIVEEELIL